MAAKHRHSTQCQQRQCGGFIGWAWEHRYLLELPRNIKTFAKVKVAERQPKFFGAEQVKAIWRACKSDRQKLVIALSLNTGMNQADIAKLTPSHLDPPYLVLRRGKTGVAGCWKLWPITWTLIEACRRRGLRKPTDLLFMTADGRPLVERGFRKDGRTFKNDSVGQLFKRVLRNAGIDGSFVMLRKTPPNILTANGYGDVVQFFLSHKNNAVFLSNGAASTEPDKNSVAQVFYVGDEAKIQALKQHPRLLAALDLLERIFEFSEPQP